MYHALNRISNCIAHDCQKLGAFRSANANYPQTYIMSLQITFNIHKGPEKINQSIDFEKEIGKQL